MLFNTQTLTNDILTAICGLLFAAALMALLFGKDNRAKLVIFYVLLAFSFAIPILRFLQII